jgi:hypothetical protein
VTTPPGGLDAPHHGFAYADGVGWPMRWAPRLTARIRHLHTAGLAEVRWCTSWCVNASQLERLFGCRSSAPRLSMTISVRRDDLTV